MRESAHTSPVDADAGVDADGVDVYAGVDEDAERRRRSGDPAKDVLAEQATSKPSASEIKHYRVGLWSVVGAGIALSSYVFLGYAAVYLLVGGLQLHHPFPVVLGIIFAPCFIAYSVVILAMLIKHPERVWRTVTLTPDEIRLPDPKCRHIPLSDIAGIALAHRVIPNGAMSKGARSGWVPTFWRIDGSYVSLFGLGLTTNKNEKDLSDSRPGRMVEDIYARVAAAQGPNGLLLTMAKQRQSHLSEKGPMDKIWDPSPTG